MKKMVAAIAILITIVVAYPAEAAETNQVSTTHRVRRGEVLTTIATHYKIDIASMMLANETYLRDKYTDVCGELSKSFRTRKRDRGTRGGGLFYCNDRLRRPYGNTLQPGWMLVVPADTAPTSVKDAIAKITGNRIAIVIDDTGSMNDDREKVSQFYLAALRQYGKRLTHVWLYSDGRVRRYEGGNVSFLTSGGRENTYGALRAAAAEKPDAIVLVTDEQGDDWDWAGVKSLPPVIAHCLSWECEVNLQRLKQETRGQYLTGLK